MFCTAHIFWHGINFIQFNFYVGVTWTFKIKRQKKTEYNHLDWRQLEFEFTYFNSDFQNKSESRTFNCFSWKSFRMLMTTEHFSEILHQNQKFQEFNMSNTKQKEITLTFKIANIWQKNVYFTELLLHFTNWQNMQN